MTNFLVIVGTAAFIWLLFRLKSMVHKFVAWSVVLLILVLLTGVLSAWNNQNATNIQGGTQKDFNFWQDKYKDIAFQLSNDPSVKDAIRTTPIEIKQVTVLQFPQIEQDGTTQQRVDRCQSCHIGLVNPAMTAENIIKVVSAGHDNVTPDKVAAYLEGHPDIRETVETLGAHPGTDIENGDNSTNLGVVHSDHLSYGVTTASSPTSKDSADYLVQKANLKRHPFPTFGCTSCHQGSGRDLVEYKAHQFVEDDPTGDIPEDAHITLIPGRQMLPAKYMEAACAQCHATYDPKSFAIKYLPEMTTMSRGETLFKQMACYGCHKIEGFSKGNVGPELTNEGRSKTPQGIAHQLWDPRYQVDTCVMPYFFSIREHNTDDPARSTEIVDPRSAHVTPADITHEDIRASLRQHGYIADESRSGDVDALVTFIASQTGENYADSQSSRFSSIASYNKSLPVDVPVTVAEGKQLFEQSGCYACHYIGNPNVKHITGDKAFGKGGIFGPELSWEGSRHSEQWLIAHYANPQAFVPGSIMPIFPFSNSQRAALSVYDQSQKPSKPGARSVSPDEDMTTTTQDALGDKTPDIRYMNR